MRSYVVDVLLVFAILITSAATGWALGALFVYVTKSFPSLGHSMTSNAPPCQPFNDANIQLRRCQNTVERLQQSPQKSCRLAQSATPF
jgi:hypothetical protein